MKRHLTKELLKVGEKYLSAISKELGNVKK